MRLSSINFLGLAAILSGCCERAVEMPVTALPDRIYTCAEEREFKSEYDALPVYDQMIRVMLKDYHRMRGTVQDCSEE